MPVRPVDADSSSATLSILKLLSRVSASDAFIFGHHNTDIEGQTWQDFSETVAVRSDVLDTTGGQFPGMTGFNLDWVATQRKLSLQSWRDHVRPLLNQGIILNLFWESSNPVTGGNARDLSGSPITEILPGGSANSVWRGWMDRIAEWLVDVGVSTQGAIFRPFHECTGSWFWWGTSASTPAQYRAAWRYTTQYLRARGVHSLLYAYSPSKPSMHWEVAYGEGGESRYPGNDEVDIACFDRYGVGDFSADLLADCSRVAAFAAAHGKLPAICEVGTRNGIQYESDKSWYMDVLLQPVLQGCPRVAFVYTWRNSGPNSYWVPLPGQHTSTGFASFFASASTIFAGDLGRLIPPPVPNPTVPSPPTSPPPSPSPLPPCLPPWRPAPLAPRSPAPPVPPATSPSLPAIPLPPPMRPPPVHVSMPSVDLHVHIPLQPLELWNAELAGVGVLALGTCCVMTCCALRMVARLLRACSRSSLTTAGRTRSDAALPSGLIDRPPHHASKHEVVPAADDRIHRNGGECWVAMRKPPSMKLPRPPRGVGRGARRERKKNTRNKYTGLPVEESTRV